MFDTITNTPLFTNKKGNTWSYQIGVTIIYEYSFGIQRTCTILWNSKLKFKCCAYKPVTDGQHEKNMSHVIPKERDEKIVCWSFHRNKKIFSKTSTITHTNVRLILNDLNVHECNSKEDIFILFFRHLHLLGPDAKSMLTLQFIFF